MFLDQPAVKQLIDTIDIRAQQDLESFFNTGKYDGYGSIGYEANTGQLLIGIEYVKREDGKISRTFSVSFCSVTGEVQDFNVPTRVTVTELEAK